MLFGAHAKRVKRIDHAIRYEMNKFALPLWHQKNERRERKLKKEIGIEGCEFRIVVVWCNCVRFVVVLFRLPPKWLHQDEGRSFWISRGIYFQSETEGSRQYAVNSLREGNTCFVGSFLWDGSTNRRVFVTFLTIPIIWLFHLLWPECGMSYCGFSHCSRMSFSIFHHVVCSITILLTSFHYTMNLKMLMDESRLRTNAPVR